jgi:hypothetical protein
MIGFPGVEEMVGEGVEKGGRGNKRKHQPNF